MNKKNIIVIISIVCILLIGGSVWYVQKNNQPDNEDYTTQAHQEGELIASDIDTSDWQTYRNEEYGFEFSYPEGWDTKYSIINGSLNEVILFSRENDDYVVEISAPSLERCFDSLNQDEYPISKKNIKSESWGLVSGKEYYQHKSVGGVILGVNSKRYETYNHYCIRYKNSETINISAPTNDSLDKIVDQIVSSFIFY